MRQQPLPDFRHVCSSVLLQNPGRFVENQRVGQRKWNTPFPENPCGDKMPMYFNVTFNLPFFHDCPSLLMGYGLLECRPNLTEDVILRVIALPNVRFIPIVHIVGTAECENVLTVNRADSDERQSTVVFNPQNFAFVDLRLSGLFVPVSVADEARIAGIEFVGSMLHGCLCERLRWVYSRAFLP